MDTEEIVGLYQDPLATLEGGDGVEQLEIPNYYLYHLVEVELLQQEPLQKVL